MNSAFSNTRSLPPLGIDLFLRSEGALLREWTLQKPAAITWLCVSSIILGAGFYGAVIGSWRDGWQALFTGLKLPLVILVTTSGNGLLNGMLAPLLGLNIPFRQTFVIVLLSFGIASLILAALSPVAWFVVWNTPPLNTQTRLSSPEYGLLQLTLASFTAFAGVVGNLKILPLLKSNADTKLTALKVLSAWLVTNLFLGSQIAWVLRPFIWDPARPVEFIGREYFRGSFYETLFEAARQLMVQ
jgi:hypothetical protein